jgi:hypothetical protein
LFEFLLNFLGAQIVEMLMDICNVGEMVVGTRIEMLIDSHISILMDIHIVVEMF